MTFKAIQGAAPQYFWELIKPKSTPKMLRSSDANLLTVPSTCTKTFGDGGGGGGGGVLVVVVVRNNILYHFSPFVLHRTQPIGILLDRRFNKPHKYSSLLNIVTEGNAECV